MASLPRGSTIQTPLGPGTVEALVSNLTDYLVLYKREDFEKEEWVTRFSPGNGPCVFKVVEGNRCVLIAEPSKVAPIYSSTVAPISSTTSTSKAPREPGAPVKVLPVSTSIDIGQIWKSNRSPAEYAVFQIMPDGQIKLKEVGSTYTRVVPPQTLVKMYTLTRIE